MADQHTDVVAVVAEGGEELAGSRAYDPFGQPLAAEGSNPAVGYQSGWTDPDSGDVNMAARWYQPGTGAFASRDTMLLNPSPSVQGNRYSYANAAPMLHTDPSGHFCTMRRSGMRLRMECRSPLPTSSEEAVEVAGAATKVVRKGGGGLLTAAEVFLNVIGWNTPAYGPGPGCTVITCPPRAADRLPGDLGMPAPAGRPPPR